jgi:hypothetical protein
MKQLISQTIEKLKDKVNNNLAEIRNNEVKFRRIIINKDINDRTSLINEIIEKNKILLAENFDCINMQINILKFIDKYKYTIAPIAGVETEADCFDDEQVIDYFEYTISGKLPFSPMHPKFYDAAFADKLITYYEQAEDYEKCADIMRIKEEQNYTQN